MTYKSGETPQKNDEVLGQIDGLPARGRVLAVRKNGDVLVTRRAPYEGPAKPLGAVQDEAPADQFVLVYRKPSAAPGAPPVKAAKGAPGAPAGAPAK